LRQFTSGSRSVLTSNSGAGVNPLLSTVSGRPPIFGLVVSSYTWTPHNFPRRELKSTEVRISFGVDATQAVAETCRRRPRNDGDDDDDDDESRSYVQLETVTPW